MPDNLPPDLDITGGTVADVPQNDTNPAQDPSAGADGVQPAVPEVAPAVPAPAPNAVANPFTAIVAAQPEDKPAENPFTKIVEARAQSDQAQEQALRNSLYGVKDTNAVRSAQVQKVAKALGMPSDLVDQNLEAMIGAEKFQAAPLAKIAAQNPTLAAYLADRDHMAVLKEDLGHLTGMDNYTAALQAHAAHIDWDPTGSLPPGFVYDRDGTGHISESYRATNQESGQGEFRTNHYDTLQQVAQTLRDRQQHDEAAQVEQQANLKQWGDTYGPVLSIASGAAQEYATFKRAVIGDGDNETEVANQLSQASQLASPGFGGDLARMAGGLLADAPGFVAGSGLAKAGEAVFNATKLAPLFSKAMGDRAAAWLGTAGKTALTMAPVNAVHAVDEGKQQGTTAGILDFLSSSAIMGATGPTGVARAFVNPSQPLVLRGWAAVATHMIKDAGLQAGQGAALVLSQALERHYAGDGKPIDSDELLRQMASQGLLGAAAGAAFAVLPALQARRAVVDTKRAAEGMDFGTKLAGMVQQYQQTKAAQHSPDALQGAVEASQANQPTHVYAQAADWQAHWLAEGQDPAAKAEEYGIGKEYREADTLKSPMAIPLPAFVRAAGESKNPLGLAGKGKSSPEAASAEEGAKFYQAAPEAIAAQAKKLGEEAAKIATEGSPESDAIHDDLLQQLRAAHPRESSQFTPEQLDTFAQNAANWFHVTAKRAGVEPMDLYRQFPLSITSDPGIISSHEALVSALTEHIGGTDATAKAAQAMEGMRTALEGKGQEMADKAVQSLPDTAAAALKATYDQPGIAVPEDATGLHHATTLRGIWKAAHGGKMPSPRDPLWQQLVEQSEIVDRARAAERSGVDPQAKTERITRLHQGANDGHTALYHVGHSLKPGEKMRTDHRGLVWFSPSDDAYGANGRTDKTIVDIPSDKIAVMETIKGGITKLAKEILDKTENGSKEEVFRAAESMGYLAVLRGNDVSMRPETAEKYLRSDSHGQGAAATDVANLQPETRAWYDKLPADVQERLGPSIDYFRQHPDPAGELGNLKMLAEIKPRQRLAQETRGSMEFGNGGYKMTLGAHADASTFFHEMMHMWTEVMGHLAQRPETPAALKADYQTMLDFSGYGSHENKARMQAEALDIQSKAMGRDLTPEERKRLDELQAPHEKLSEALERYMMEGKAPADELRPLFARIKTWMKQVYKTLKAFRVELSPEIRGVFDRFQASDEAIAKAREYMGEGEPIFKSAAEAGWTQEQFDAYTKAVGEERASEEARLEHQVQRELARQKSDAYKAKQDDVREQVTAAMDQEPVWNALNVLRGNEGPAGSGIKGPFRLDRDSIVEAYGVDGLKKLPGRKDFASNLNNRGNALYTSEHGVPLDAAARVLGYRTGDDLYQALANAPHKAAAVEAQTRDIMEQKYPTLQNVLAEKAMESLHSDRRSRLIMRVLDSLGVKTGQRPAPVELLRAVAKDTIANRATKDVRPAVYRVAEAKAAREVLKAMAKGDYEGAFAAQQRRLLSAELFRAATDAMDRLDRFNEWQARFDKESKRTQLIKASSDRFAVTEPDGTRTEYPTQAAAEAKAQQSMGTWEPVSDFMDAVDALRARYGLSDRKSPSTVRNLVSGLLEEAKPFQKFPTAEAAEMSPEDFAEEQKRMAGVSMSDEMIDGPGAGSLQLATVAEMDELRGALANVEKLAMDRGKAITAESALTFQQERERLIGQLQESRRTLRKVTSTPSVFDKLALARDSMDAWHKALSTYAHEMDGYKEGGPWWDALVRPLNDAATKKAEMAAKDAEAFDKLAKEWGKRDNLGSIYRRQHYDFINDDLSLMGRIMVALNWGAKHNRERLTTGHGWTAEQVGKIIDTLDKKDMDFVQGIWDHIASKWPDIKAQDQRLFGTELEQRETVPVQTKHGLYKGGYLPIKYDPRKSGQSAAMDQATAISENRRGAFGAAKTSGSFTKRVSDTTGRPLLLDESVIFRHLDEVAQRLTHEDAMKGIRRLLMNKEVTNAIDQTHGVLATRMIRDAVTDAAKGTEQLGGMWKILGHLNKGVLSAAFGLNVCRGIRDFAESLQQTVIRAGLVNTLSGLRKWGTNAITMEGSAKKIAAMSGVMADRQRTRLRQASDAMKSAALAGSFRKRMSLISQACMHKFHLMTDHVSFLANLEKAKQEFPEDSAKAIAVAEGMTKDANGSGQTVDLAKVQRGNELMKSLTLAYGFFSKTYQAQRIAAGRAGVESITNPMDYVRAARKDPAKVARLFVDYMTLYSFPIAMDMMIKQAIYGNPDKEKSAAELAMEFAKEHAAFGLATMVGLRELSGAVTFGGSYGGPAGARGISALYDLIAHGGQMDHKAERAAVQALGILFHLPGAAIQRAIDGYAYAAEHDENAPTTLIRAATGKPPRIMQ